MFKKLLFLSAYCLLLLRPEQVLADNAARANELLSFFKSGCSLDGEWTNTAVVQAQALIDSLKAIENDEDCKTASGIISNLSNMQSSLGTVQQNSNDRQIFALENKQQTLLLELSQTTDPSLISTITNELRQLQSDLAILQGYATYDSNNNQNSQTEKELRSILATTSSMFKSLEANQACWSKYPGILSTAGTLGGTIATAFASTGYGLIVKAATDLIGQVVDFSRKWNLKTKINKAAHPISSLAFQCGTEKITENWCGAEDARKSVELKELLISQDFNQDNIWVGIRILDRDLPRLLDWLKEVRAGAEPTTQADADRMNRAIFREASVRTSKIKVTGILNENADLFTTAGSREAQWKIMQRVLIAIADTTGDSSVLSEIYPESYAPYFLLGIAADQAPRNPNDGSYQNINFFPLPNDLNFNFELVLERFKTWFERAEVTIQNELNQVLQVDPLGVISNAVDLQGNPNRATPRIAISRIRDFLIDNIPDTFATSNHRMIYQETINNLDKIAFYIDEVFADEDPMPAAVALVNISKETKLNFGTIFIKNRILRSIRYSLNDVVIRRSNDGDNLASQLLAADDVINGINRFSPTGALNLSSIRQQIAQAQSMSQATLYNFTRYFGRKIKNTLEEYDRLASRSGENEFGANKMAKAALCLKLLSVDKWPSKIPFELCKGVKLEHINPKGPKITLTEELKDKPYLQRACTYRDYMRKTYIFNRFRIPVKK